MLCDLFGGELVDMLDYQRLGMPNVGITIDWTRPHNFGVSAFKMPKRGTGELHM